jgi:hypothetical protein
MICCCSSMVMMEYSYGSDPGALSFRRAELVHDTVEGGAVSPDGTERADGGERGDECRRG